MYFVVGIGSSCHTFFFRTALALPVILDSIVKDETGDDNSPFAYLGEAKASRTSSMESSDTSSSDGGGLLAFSSLLGVLPILLAIPFLAAVLAPAFGRLVVFSSPTILTAFAFFRNTGGIGGSRGF